MRRLGLVAFLSVLGYAGTASAQQPPPTAPPGQDRSNSHFDLHENKAGDAEAADARGRMAAGDCAGALSHFDAALRTSQEPELRRDRGLCHDKLGDKYPARDDLRAYLAAKPNAPDAEQIRARVQQLETELDNDKPIRNTATATGAAAENNGEVFAVNRGEHTNRHAELIGAKPGEPERDYSYYKKQEMLRDQANDSALRYGHGVVVSAFVGVPRYFIVDGDTSKISYMAGGRLGYSTGKWITIYAELGLAGSGTRSDANNVTSGPMTALGAELRIGITDRASDQILVRAAAGYEHYVTEGTRAITHFIPGRFALGYRHVFGPSVGLEILFEGGPGVAIDEHSNSTFLVNLAGNAGIALGF